MQPAGRIPPAGHVHIPPAGRIPPAGHIPPAGPILRPQRVLLSSADSSEDAPPPVQPPSANRSTPLATYRQLGKRSRAWEDDEEERKRRKEAEEMAKSLSRPKSVACGVGYNGDQEEKRYSDDAKDKIKKRLPALKNNMLLFHYMVWSTLERLDCNHCRKCPNEFQP